MPRQERQRARRGRSATTLVAMGAHDAGPRPQAAADWCTTASSTSRRRGRYRPTGVRGADHRVGVRTRRTSVVYQARDDQGSAGMGRTLRRCTEPTASLGWARLGTVKTFGEQPACPPLGQPLLIVTVTAPTNAMEAGHQSSRSTTGTECQVGLPGGGQQVFEPAPPSVSLTRCEPHPARRAVVRKISAHSHHEHLTTRITIAFAQVRTVELRGLEPLTL